jgi:peroxiredoxin family protein
MADKLAMVVFSGTVDRLMPVGIIASGAVAMGAMLRYSSLSGD